MAWVDSHCHLNHESFSHDLEQVLQRARAEGIHQFVVPGTASEHWESQQALTQEHTDIHLAFGIHPWFCEAHQEEDLDRLDDVLDGAVAVGECGLDLMPKSPNIDTQRFWFEAQLELAKKHDLPTIVHNVKAHHLVFESLKNMKSSRGVIHGFSGNMQQAQVFIDCGYYIGIGTRLISTHSEKAQNLLRQLPLRHILLETDAPDGMGNATRNEPKQLILVANVVAKLRNQSAQEILNTCSQNAKELFNL